MALQAIAHLEVGTPPKLLILESDSLMPISLAVLSTVKKVTPGLAPLTFSRSQPPLP